MRSREQHPQRDDDEREVERQPDHPLLGRDGQRDRVRGADRLLGRGLCGLAVLHRERARAVARDRLGLEQSGGAADQVRAAARRGVERLRAADVQVNRRRRGDHQDGAHGERRGQQPRAAHTALQRSPPSTARPASSAANEDCENVSTRPAQSTARTSELATIVRVRCAQISAPRERDHDDRQEAPVDVRIEEQRVDPEVRLELVRRDHLRVEQQVARGVLVEADAGEDDARGRREQAGTGSSSAESSRTRTSSANSSANGT